ncbi:MAG: single-stranded DNA-binding protein [Alphaproteobacteria bacterium]|jgi:single-strand DNA-binding protein|nr:single-stranded DNA-binding protein [Alphaproteobacteria bacterium]
MLNRVTLQGNIGRVPSIALTQDGREVASFSMATTQNWKDESGEWQSATDWHQITVFRESTIRWIKDILKRGDPVCVEGKLTYQQWTDKYGQPRRTSHVVVAGREGRVECFKPRTQEQNPLSKNPEPEEQQILGREEAPLLDSSNDLDDTFSNQPCRSLDPVNIH